jgi:DNA primase
VDSFARERLLIAALLNHPDLIHKVFEEFSKLRLSNPELDNIRKAIIEKATSKAPLDLEGLRNNLQGGEIANASIRLVEELTGTGIAHLDPFARPGTAIDQVVKDWSNVFRWHRLDEMRRELKDAEDELGRDLTDEKQGRFFALRDAVAAATAEAVGLEEI